jgi:hypothetical protein
MTFSDDVVITADDIEIGGTSNGTFLESRQIGLIYDAPAHRLTMEFDTDKDGFYGDSLPDDVYFLTLNYESITCPGGQRFGDSNGTDGDGSYTERFHRLFGDADGSAVVDFKDFSLLASHWLNIAAETGLDANSDNIVNFMDLAEFASNWLDSL